MFLKLLSISHCQGQQKGHQLSCSLLADFALLAVMFPFMLFSES